MKFISEYFRLVDNWNQSEVESVRTLVEIRLPNIHVSIIQKCEVAGFLLMLKLT